MARMVKCVLLGHGGGGSRSAALSRASWASAIYEQVSKAGWKRWLAHQTMLINEYRLTPTSRRRASSSKTEMEKFFFGGGSEKPEGYVEPK